MGSISLTFIFTFAVYLTYYSLIAGQAIDAAKTTIQSSPSITNEQLPKNPWVRALNKRFRPFSYGLMPMRRPDTVANFLSDFDMLDDNDVDKRFDDYGHMRFGKRGGGEGEAFDDYGESLVDCYRFLIGLIFFYLQAICASAEDK
jgi:hypothetical protein